MFSRTFITQPDPVEPSALSPVASRLFELWDALPLLWLEQGIAVQKRGTVTAAKGSYTPAAGKNRRDKPAVSLTHPVMYSN